MREVFSAQNWHPGKVGDYVAICLEREIVAVDFLLQHYKFRIGAFRTDGCVDFIDMMFTSLVNVWESTPQCDKIPHELTNE